MPDPEVIAARIARWDREGPQGPLTLEVYPTLACNLDCRFCDTTERHRPPVHELSTARWLEILTEAAQMGVRRVFVLGGGEPLARPDAPRLLAHIKALGLEGILTTNGTLLRPPLIQQLLQTGWDEIHVSIDGPTAAIHDDLRGQAGAFRRTVRATCQIAVEKRRQKVELPRIALHMVLTARNCHTLPEMIRLAHALGAFRVDVDDLIAYRPAQQALQLSASQRAQAAVGARQALKLADALGIATTLERFVQAERPERGSVLPQGSGEGGLRGAPCLKAWHYLVIQADGRSSPCCVLAGEGGSIQGRTLQQLWQQDEFLEQVRAGMRAGQPLPRCRECSGNILAHEAEIRKHLPVGTEGRWPSM